MKGPRLRICPPTQRFPNLDAPSYFQDGYPLLVVSEESIVAVQEQIRGMVGVQGVEEKWSNDTLQVERWAPLNFLRIVRWIYYRSPILKGSVPI